MKIAYFVHDLADDAVQRRVRMLRCFAEVVLFGFHRGAAAPTTVAGVAAIDLGPTADARFAQRALAVLRAGVRLGHWQAPFAGVSLVMARQLETLTLAALVRRQFAPAAPLVFECLDIHRLMLARNVVGMALRQLEARLLQRCALLIVSSPAFLTNHFARYRVQPPHLLLENKVLAADLPADVPRQLATLRALSPPPGPPWRIGWFGVLRCCRSLHILAALANCAPGLVEIVMRGRPRPNVIPDFAQVVAATPGLSFHGAYDRHADLADIYRAVHFTWAIDFFEAGANSQWLLPNRLYEGALFGAVPVALGYVQTGGWLAERQCGVCLAATSDAELTTVLRNYFTGLSPDRYAAARRALARIPVAALLDDHQTCDRFGAVLEALPRRTLQ